MRVRRQWGVTDVSYVWDVAGGLPTLLQDGSKTYVYGDRLLYTADGTGAAQPGNLTWHFGDKTGSTAVLMDNAGNPLGWYSYDVFGAVRSHTGASTEFSYTGEQNDPNGLEYLRARYYDPSMGRFLSRDPMGAAYRYAGNNPVNATDPSGLYTSVGAAMLEFGDDPGFRGLDGAGGGGPPGDGSRAGGIDFLGALTGLTDYVAERAADGSNVIADGVGFVTTVGVTAMQSSVVETAIISLDIMAVGLDGSAALLFDTSLLLGPEAVAVAVPIMLGLELTANVATAASFALGCAGGCDNTSATLFALSMATLEPNLSVGVSVTTLAYDLGLDLGFSVEDRGGDPGGGSW